MVEIKALTPDELAEERFWLARILSSPDDCLQPEQIRFARLIKTITTLEDAIVEFVQADDEYDAYDPNWTAEGHRIVFNRVQAADKVLREIAKGVQR